MWPLRPAIAAAVSALRRLPSAFWIDPSADTSFASGVPSHASMTMHRANAEGPAAALTHQVLGAIPDRTGRQLGSEDDYDQAMSMIKQATAAGEEWDDEEASIGGFLLMGEIARAVGHDEEAAAAYSNTTWPKAGP